MIDGLASPYVAQARRVTVLDAGELVEQGPTRLVLSPSRPFTVSFVETTACLAAKAGSGPGGPPSTGADAPRA